MAQMGKYCKAYPVRQLREFSGWREKESKNGEAGSGAPAEHPYLYLQENYTVTAGIFLDEQVVFDEVTPEWIDFCKNTLQFEATADGEEDIFEEETAGR